MALLLLAGACSGAASDELSVLAYGLPWTSHTFDILRIGVEMFKRNHTYTAIVSQHIADRAEAYLQRQFGDEGVPDRMQVVHYQGIRPDEWQPDMTEASPLKAIEAVIKARRAPRAAPAAPLARSPSAIPACRRPAAPAGPPRPPGPLSAPRPCPWRAQAFLVNCELLITDRQVMERLWRLRALIFIGDLADMCSFMVGEGGGRAGGTVARGPWPPGRLRGLPCSIGLF
jgi:hypothetical protein